MTAAVPVAPASPVAASSASCVVCGTPLTLLDAPTRPTCRAQSCRWAYASAPPERHCAVCGRLLDADRFAHGVCASEKCRWQIVHAKREELRRREAARAAAARAFRDEQGAAAGVADVASYPVAVVPGRTTRLVPLPRARVRAFREHLVRIIAEAFARRAAGEPAPDPRLEYVADFSPPEPEPPPEDVAALLGHGCATCGGWCCGQGDTRAFLSAAVIRRHIDAHPEATPREVRRAYLRHLVAETYDGSCVYHGEFGCTLPRAMRSGTCNRYLCGPLAVLMREVVATGRARAFYATAEGSAFEAAAFVDARDVRVVRHREDR